MSDSTIWPLLVAAIILGGACIALYVLVIARLAAHPAKRLAQRYKTLATLFLAGVIVSTGLFGFHFYKGNVHTVVAGELYRSGQLDPSRLAEIKSRFGIRSIINLRGENIGKTWYKDEIDEASRLDIQHIDFPMSAKRGLTEQSIRHLVNLMKNAPKPLLLHCQSGSDRTGLAAAIYLSAIAGKPEEAAEAQLSAVFGHLVIPYISEAQAIDETWERYEHSLPVSDTVRK